MRTPFIKHRCLLAALGLGLMLAPAQAEEAKATSAIVFKGTSTLHGFEGSVTSQPFIVTFNQKPETGQVVVSAAAAVSVPDMTTAHKKRDKNMYKMLDQKNFTLISGALADAPIPAEGTGKAILKLKIRNVEREVAATLSDWKRDAGQVGCKMAFDVSLKAFGLKPPSVLGVIRVGDTVQVECNLQGTVQ